jgi:hypothetical protein
VYVPGQLAALANQPLYPDPALCQVHALKPTSVCRLVTSCSLAVGGAPDPQPSSSTVDQQCTELRFQSPLPGAQCRLGDKAGFCRSREIAVLCKGHQVLQLPERRWSVYLQPMLSGNPIIEHDFARWTIP